jgi:hypothetical protein
MYLMSLIEILFSHPAIRRLPPEQRKEVDRLLEELVKIGRLDDFLSLQPGGPFDIRCHHVRSRQIGTRLDELGGLELMQAARSYVKRKLKKTNLAEHLDYCWQDIGEWKP